MHIDIPNYNTNSKRKYKGFLLWGCKSIGRDMTFIVWNYSSLEVSGQEFTYIHTHG